MFPLTKKTHMIWQNFDVQQVSISKALRDSGSLKEIAEDYQA